MARESPAGRVFYGLLIDSPSPAADLAALGLEPELARWAGVPAIEVEGTWVRAPIMEVGGRFGFGQVAMFYLGHPGRLVKVAQRCAHQGLSARDARLGNYTRDSGNPPSTLAPSYTGWSTMKLELLPTNLWFLATFFGAFFGVSLWELRSGLDTSAGRTALLLLSVAVMTVMAFGIVVTAGGSEDPVTDLFVCRILLDVCLLSAAAWLAARFARLLPRLPQSRS